MKEMSKVLCKVLDKSAAALGVCVGFRQGHVEEFEQGPFASLPADTLQRIHQQLDSPQDAMAMASTCSAWHQALATADLPHVHAIDATGASWLQANLHRISSLALTVTDKAVHLLDAFEDPAAAKLEALHLMHRGNVSLFDRHLLAHLRQYGRLHTSSISCHLKNLQELKIEHFCFNDRLVTKGLVQLHQLTELSISKSSGWSRLPVAVSAELTALQVLSLQYCRNLECLQLSREGVGGLVGLRQLEVQCCSSIKRIEGLGTLWGLTQLTIKDCSNLQLSGLASCISSLTGLVKLHIASGLHSPFWASEDTADGAHLPPTTFSSLQQLQHLELSQLSTPLLSKIGMLTGLTALVVSNCLQLTAIEGLTNLQQLQRLELGGCPLLQLQPGWSDQAGDWLSGLSSLHSLKVWGEGNLKAFTASIGHLTGLTRLSLGDYQGQVIFAQEEQAGGEMGGVDGAVQQQEGLTEALTLPVQFAKLSRLEVLELSKFPHLTRLPSSIGCLSSLKSLDLNQVGIISLPGSVGSLRQLERVCLWMCGNLATLPVELGRLPELKLLNVQLCGMKKLPRAISRPVKQRGGSVSFIGNPGKVEKLLIQLYFRYWLIKSLD